MNTPGILLIVLSSILSSHYLNVNTGNSVRKNNEFQEQYNSRIPARTESRSEIKNYLSEKIKSGKPLVAHVFVPLCDNDHQGIVPVNSQLGDGLNLRTNLYWGAGYGVKSYFKLKTDWKLLLQISNPSKDILERVVFYKKLSNNSKVYLVADAFRGDRMKESLHSFFGSLSGKNKDTVFLADKTSIPIASSSDLLIFNGHDGLMDDTITPYFNQNGRIKDVMVIACYSHVFFSPLLEKSGGYPLVTTTGLLAPEAYVMHAAIENWALMKSDNEIRLAAGDAYYSKHPKSTQGGCRALFKTGW